MSDGWVAKMFGIPVEKREIKRPNNKPYYTVSSTLIGVLHTTEASTVDKSWDVLNQQRSAPHFITGQGRIVQCRPLGKQGAALRTNSPHTPNAHAQIQIEMATHTAMQGNQTKLWLPTKAVLEPTVAVMAWCAKNLGIPLQKPYPWPDDGFDLKGTIWAANNKRRKQAAAGLWPLNKGWWMHVEVPSQQPTWHHDCGQLRRTEMFSLAQELLNNS